MRSAKTFPANGTPPVLAPAPEAPTVGLGRLVLAALFTSLLYAALSTASAGICPGGVDSSGGFIDADGLPTTARPVCLLVNFHPQRWVLLLLAAIVIVAAVLTARATRVERARRIVVIATLSIVAIGIVATLASFPAFYSGAVTQWRGGPVPHFWFDAVTTITKESN